MLSAKIIEHFL